eukprot:snap_masked-scaffold_23-processed-gene-5.18-mRNA-1 protein AED:1.00 eAED:1.00 QI:0/0/0/0/1/1/2/0/342
MHKKNIKILAYVNKNLQELSIGIYLSEEDSTRIRIGDPYPRRPQLNSGPPTYICTGDNASAVSKMISKFKGSEYSLRALLIHNFFGQEALDLVENLSDVLSNQPKLKIIVTGLQGSSSRVIRYLLVKVSGVRSLEILHPMNQASENPSAFFNEEQIRVWTEFPTLQLSNLILSKPSSVKNLFGLKKNQVDIGNLYFGTSNQFSLQSSLVFSRLMKETIMNLRVLHLSKASSKVNFVGRINIFSQIGVFNHTLEQLNASFVNPAECRLDKLRVFLSSSEFNGKDGSCSKCFRRYISLAERTANWTFKQEMMLKFLAAGRRSFPDREEFNWEGQKVTLQSVQTF